MMHVAQSIFVGGFAALLKPKKDRRGKAQQKGAERDSPGRSQ